MDNNAILPWQVAQWRLLWEAKKHDRLSHALLFVGAAGLGKMQLAERFAAALLCEQSDYQEGGCHQCHACRLMTAKSHPDYHVIAPEETGKMIKIDSIRHVASMSNETTLHGGYRIVIINSAHAMNSYAANALLKTLEEPVSKTLFILISEQSLRLPLTIASRCQKIIFNKPEKHVALDWLRTQPINREVDLALLLSVAEGAPLQAHALIEQGLFKLRKTIYDGLCELKQGGADPLKLAAEWKEYDMVVVFHLLLNWLRDLLRLQFTEKQADLINDDYKNSLMTLADRWLPREVVASIERVQERYAMMLGLQSINKQLLLEELLVSVV